MPIYIQSCVREMRSHKHTQNLSPIHTWNLEHLVDTVSIQIPGVCLATYYLCVIYKYIYIYIP